MKNIFSLTRAVSAAQHFPGLLIEAEKIARSYMKGMHGRRRIGIGETFWQFRHYQSGDTSKDIDWKQSARHDSSLFVRQREWEAAQTVYLYRDSSRSMHYASSKELMSKQNYADILLLAACFILLDGGEQVSLLGTDLAPQTNIGSIHKIYESMEAQKQLHETARPLAAHAHCVIISDFCYPLSTIQPTLERFVSRNIKGTLIHIYDPAEEVLPFAGRVNFLDLENPSDEKISIDQVETIREKYHQKFKEHQQSIALQARAWGWDFITARTDTPVEHTLEKIYDSMTVK